MKVIKKEGSDIGSVDFNNLVFGRKFTDHMISCEYDGESWGEMVIEPLHEIAMHPATHVFHYGQAVFEGLKAYRTVNGDVNLFRVKDNLNRLNRSSERMAIPSIDPDKVLEAIDAWMKLDKEWVPGVDQGSLYIRPFVIATSPTLYAVPSVTYRFMLIASPVGFYYAEPIRIRLETKYHRAAAGGVGAAKAAGNYGASFMPASKGRAEGFNQLLWTDSSPERNIEELGSANFFYLCGQDLYTPALHDSILAGITRDSVIELAKDQGLNVVEAAIPKAQLLQHLKDQKVSCVFATGTAAAIAYIKEISIEEELYTIDSVNNPEVKMLGKRLHEIKRGMQDRSGWNHLL